jgi:NitT/TauT family transport system substrate-binding protein
VIGGQADAAFLLGTPAIPLIERGEAKLAGWSGDETPEQFGALFVSTKTANQRGPEVERFLRAYRRGARDYHDAFIGPGEIRRDGPGAPAVLSILAQATGLSIEQAKAGIIYIDAEAGIDERDVLRQAEWYRAQSMVKERVDPAMLFDQRHDIELPRRQASAPGKADRRIAAHKLPR